MTNPIQPAHGSSGPMSHRRRTVESYDKFTTGILGFSKLWQLILLYLPNTLSSNIGLCKSSKMHPQQNISKFYWEHQQANIIRVPKENVLVVWSRAISYSKLCGFFITDWIDIAIFHYSLRVILLVLIVMTIRLNQEINWNKFSYCQYFF